MKPIVESRVYARAGLLGNPSDGYGGKTISFSFEQFFATVRLSESPKIIICPGDNDRNEFASPQQLSDHVRDNGFYGGVRLIKSAIKHLHDYCREFGESQLKRTFEISYRSNIPRQVGLAGSSAIVLATLRSLSRWNEFELEPAILAALALQSEQALGIAAGPQDRVIQAYEGVMYMDFEKPVMRNGLSCGAYTRLEVTDNHYFYIAFSTDAAEPTEALHGDLKRKMVERDGKTVAAIHQIAELAQRGKIAVETADWELLAHLIDSNFDLRQQVCTLNPRHVRMVETARSVGASAKYCGSGGAIVGTYRTPEMFEALKRRLVSIGCQVIRPKILEPGSYSP